MQLSDLGFQLIKPSALLRPYISEYWYFKREIPLATYHDQYMHPHGGFGIAFNFGDQLRLDGEPLTLPVFLDAANTFSRKLGFMGRVELLGVRFCPGGAYPFLGIPLIELQNQPYIEGTLISLHAQMAELPTVSAKVQLLEGWLIHQLSLGKEQHIIVPASLARLREDIGLISIPDLADELGISQRQLERVYQQQVGMSPKQYARLQRIDLARLALKQKQSNTYLAMELGFYDQAHFIREFRAVIGTTPYVYMKRKQG
jgi:AraC-like DNA-binding protein